MKKLIYIAFAISTIFLLTGCEDNTLETNTGKSKEEKQVIKKVETNEGTVNTSKMTQLYCVRNATAAAGIEVNIHYDVFYTGDRLNLIHSFEQIMSADENNLDTYEKAYREIHAHYEGLEYYDTSVVRGDTTVTSEITINYDKVDADKLLAIEGETDNIYENKIPKYSKWIALAKRLGITCEEVEK